MLPSMQSVKIQADIQNKWALSQQYNSLDVWELCWKYKIIV